MCGKKCIYLQRTYTYICMSKAALHTTQAQDAGTHDTPNKIISARNRNYALAVCNHLTENVYTTHNLNGSKRAQPPLTTHCSVLRLAIFIYIKYGIDVMGDPNPTIGQMKQEKKVERKMLELSCCWLSSNYQKMFEIVCCCLYFRSIAGAGADAAAATIAVRVIEK